MMSPYKERRNRSFSSDCEDGMEESSVLSSLSPPRSCRKTVSTFGLDNAFHACDTPKTRRLFDDCDEDAEDYAKHSPCQPSSHRDVRISEAFVGFPVESVLPLSRKRSSQNNGTMRSSAQSNKSHMDTSGSDESDVTMYASPRISPNSFITMDGRFVQSKNPFSSPMMDDTPVPHSGVNLSSSTKAAPSLPVSFFSSSLESNIPSLLPPRSNNRLLPSATSCISTKASTPIASDNDHHERSFGFKSGYPDKRFSFTGSPIMETANETVSSDSGIASSASLRKVRKLNLCDDVVSATSHDLTGRQARGNTAFDNGVHGYGDWILEEQGVSPTDVQDFPPPTPTKSCAPPPTPVKSRPTHDPYNSSRRRNFGTPGPPLLERRRPGPARTPFAGLQEGAIDDDIADGDCVQAPKSRFYSDFDVIGELGEGSFGKVYKVLSRLDGCMYAIKAAHRQAKGSSDRDRMLKEVYALAALSDLADTANFHIVRFHQAWMEEDRLFIQTELCMGTLSEEIARGGLVDEKRRYKLLREMLLALDLIHRNNMVHLDIKPDNIFIKNDQYKLGDFGLVTKLSANQDVEEGDSRYMSMELLLGEKTDLRKSDIFSLGATLYEICLGRSLPMNGQEWRDIRSGNICSLPSSGDDLVNIIRQMIDPIPASRPTPSELLQHRQLLSDEQKALKAAKTKVMQANMQLAAQEQRFQRLGPAFIQRKGLTRANTWNGTTFPYP